MKFKTRDICSSFQKKGFRQEETHHTFYWLYYNGSRTHIKTKISHGLDEYGNDLLTAMRKQLQLDSVDQLNKLIECPMSYDDYIKHLKDKNQL